MVEAFPKTANFRGFMEPVRVEADIHDLVIEGEIPPVLRNGSLYRLGPDASYPPLLGDDVGFNGDGMMRMFRFGEDKVDFKSRYVRTERFELEHAAGRALFGAYRNRYTADPSVRDKDAGTANTTPIWHGGKLLALKEDSLPVEVDPDTLETLGRYDYDGKYTAAFCAAHPRFDPDTGDMLFFGYNAKGDCTPDIAFYVANPAGEIIKEEWIVAPYASMLHDFAITENYVIFPIMPTTTDLARVQAGGDYWAWDGSKETHIGIMPRNGTAADLRWFRGPARWVYHFVNAYERGNQIIIDAAVSDRNYAMFIKDMEGKAGSPEETNPEFRRWTIDMSPGSDSFEESVLVPGFATLPIFDWRFSTKKHRYAFALSPTDPLAFRTKGSFMPPKTCVGRYDLDTGDFTRAQFPEDSSLEEPCFVARSPDAPEGDGYLLCVVDRFAENRIDLVAIDTADMEAGPVMTVKLPIRQRPAIHGAWISADARITQG